MIFAGKVLENGNTLQEYSIQKDSTLNVIVARALDISKGDIVITETGYSVGSTAETTYTGRYVIYGETTQNTISIGGNTHHISFVSLNMRFSESSDLIKIESQSVFVDLLGENVLQATDDGGGSAIKMSDSTVLHFNGSGHITLVGGSNYWGGSHAVSGGSLYIDGGAVTLIGGNKIVNSYGHSFEGKALVVRGGTLYCGVGYLDNGNLAAPSVSAPVQVFCGTLTKAVAHSLTYSKNEGVITEECANDCGHTATATWISSAASYPYTGLPITPLIVERSSNWLGDIDVIYENNTNVGMANASIKIGEASVIKTFEIMAADICGATVTINPESGKYTGSAFAPSATVDLSGFGTLAEGEHFNVSWDKFGFTDAGVYTATITGIGNFTGTVTKEFLIDKGTPTVAPPVANDLAYTGDAQALVAAGNTSGGILLYTLGTDADTAPADDDGWNTAIPTGKNAGIYTVWYKVVGDDNCNGVAAKCIVAEIKNAMQEAPKLTDVTVTDETIFGKKDGKIHGLDIAMEYSTEADGEYTKITDPDNMTFAPGIYYVRYAAKTNFDASEPTAITVNAGDKITVTYVVEGDIIDTVFVDYGADVDMSEVKQIPQKAGYDKTAPYWNHDGKNIIADTTITAVYTINKYTVTYVADGETVDTQTVEHGKNAAAPQIPGKDGYTAAWDKDGKNINEDVIITAVYTEISSPTEPGESTKPEETEPEASSPATGDDSHIVLYGSMFTISLTAIVILLFASKKRKQAN